MDTIEEIVQAHARALDTRADRDRAICEAIAAGHSAYGIAKRMRIRLGEDAALTPQGIRSIAARIKDTKAKETC